MKIAVVGAGAMGGLFGGRLAKAGHKVTLVGREKEAVAVINQRGILLEDKLGACETIPVFSTTRAADAGIVDLVLVLVKCHHTEQAVLATEDIIGPQTLVLSLQNGWGHTDCIARIVGTEKMLVGVTYHGATLAGPGHVQHMTEGVTHIGRLIDAPGGQLAEIAAAFTAAKIGTNVSACIRAEIWSKLSLSAVCLSPSALLRCYTGDLKDRPGSVVLIRSLLREIVAVATKLGVSLDYEERWALIASGLEKGKSAKTSMLQDVLKRRVTEIDCINGAIVAEGRKHNVATPYNECLVSLIKALEDGFTTPGYK